MPSSYFRRRQIDIADPRQIRRYTELQVGMEIGQVALIGRTPAFDRAAVAGAAAIFSYCRRPNESRLQAAARAFQSDNTDRLLPQWRGTVHYASQAAVYVRMQAVLPDGPADDFSEFIGTALTDLPELKKTSMLISTTESLGLAAIGSTRPINTATTNPCDIGRWQPHAIVRLD